MRLRAASFCEDMHVSCTSIYCIYYRRDLRSLDPHWVRGSLIGYINQEPILFATSIMENIRYGKPSAPDSEVG